MSLHINSATVQAIKTEYYKRNFYEFRKLVAPWKGQEFVEGWWQREIAKHVNQFYLDLKAGLRPKLVIKSPPQFGKSQQVIDAIAWMMMRDPNMRTIFTSYSERLGIRANLTIQRIWSNPNWLQMFPHINIGSVETDKKGTISKPGRNRELIDLWPHGGMFRNTTIGGPITGESLDCLVEGTIVETDRGPMPIEYLGPESWPIKVLAYRDGELSYETVSNFTTTHSHGIYRVTTKSGRIFESTGDHRVFTPKRGEYTFASSLSKGETVLCLLPEGIPSTSGRCSQDFKAQCDQSILLQKMPMRSYSSSEENNSQMPGLRSRFGLELLGTLLSYLSRESTPKAHDRVPRMPGVFKNLSKKIHLSNTLLKRMLRGGPFCKYENKWESSLEQRCVQEEDNGPKSKGIQSNKTENTPKRWSLLRKLWQLKQTKCSSYRWMAIKQFARESSYSVLPMSCKSPSGHGQGWEYDFIESVERVREEAITYDITVNNAHNFFANGVLVHNCGIVDDFLKGRSDANSLNTRDKTWEWFTDDFFTRFSERAGFLVIGTNWHVDDPMQRMIEKFPDIKVVSYPAIATEDELYRKKGESLFPELKSIEFLLERKGIMPIGNWEALYQQNPFVQGGEKFKEAMIDFRPMPEKTDYEFITVDTSYKSGKENDYTVATLFAMAQGELYVKDVWRTKIDAADIEMPLGQFIQRHKHWNFRQTWIEPKGHGIYLNQKFATQGMGIPSNDDLKAFFQDRRLDKIERANNSLPHLASRKLHINIDLSDREDLKSELLQFPNGKHDDFVDTVIDGLKIAFGRTPSILDVL